MRKKLNFRCIYKNRKTISNRRELEWIEVNINNRRILVEQVEDDKKEYETILTAYDGEKGTVLKMSDFFDLLQHYNRLKEMP
jgi:hypothetical protein